MAASAGGGTNILTRGISTAARLAASLVYWRMRTLRYHSAHQIRPLAHQHSCCRTCAYINLFAARRRGGKRGAHLYRVISTRITVYRVSMNSLHSCACAAASPGVRGVRAQRMARAGGRKLIKRAAKKRNVVTAIRRWRIAHNAAGMASAKGAYQKSISGKSTANVMTWHAASDAA